MKKNRLRFCLLLTALGASSLSVSDVSAAGYAIRLHSAIQAGAAHSYGAALRGIEGIIDNPATAAYQMASAILVNMQPVVPTTKFHGSYTGLTPNTHRYSRDAAGTAVVPSFAAVFKMSERFNVLVSTDSPFGLKTDYAQDWPGRNFNILSDMFTSRFSMGGSYRPNGYVSFGAAVQLLYTNAELTRNFPLQEGAAGVVQGLMLAGAPTFGISQQQINLMGGAVANSFIGTDDTRIRLKGRDWSWGGSFGFVVTPTCHMRLGFSYTSVQATNARGSVTSNSGAYRAGLLDPSQATITQILRNVIGDNAFQALGVVRQTSLIASTIGALKRVGEALEAHAYTKVKHPDVYTISAGYDISPMFTVMATGQYTKWNKFTFLNIYSKETGHLLSSTTFNFQDTWFFSTGLEVRASDSLTLRLGGALDSPAVRDKIWRQPAIPDAARKWLSIGATKKFSKHWNASIGYTHEFVSKSRSHLVKPEKGTLEGNYKQHVDFVGIQVKYSFS